MFKISYIYDLVDNISPQLKKIQSNLNNAKYKVFSTAVDMGDAFDKLSKKLDVIGKKTMNFGKNMFVKTTLPIGLLGNNFIKNASDYNESINKIDVAFGKSSQSVKDFANNAGKNFGINKIAALDTAATFGDIATSMGFSTEEAAKMSIKLVGLAGDLNSFKNLAGDQAKNALKAIFTGETQSIIELGVVMTETAVQNYLTMNNISKKLSSMTPMEKVAVRYKYVLATLKNAEGDFLRTIDGHANQVRVLKDQYTTLSITLGTLLLPHVNKFLSYAIKLIEKFNSLDPSTKKFILIIAGILFILPPIIIAFASLIFLAKGLMIGFGLLAGVVVFLYTPLGIALLLFGRLAFALYGLKDELIIIYDFLKDKFAGAFDYVADKIKMVMDLINKFRTDSAVVLNFLGLEKMANFVSPEINQPSQINKSQSLTAGGELNVNIKGLPKGSNSNFTPRPNSFLPVGINSVFAGT